MKLLGLCLSDHDANISYYDGSTVHYYKLERDTGVKHDIWYNMYDWRETIQRVWGVDYRDVDDIAVIVSPQIFNLPSYSDFYPYEEYDLFPGRIVDRLDHYYAHYMSGDMLYPCDTHIVVDGCDDVFKYCWSVIKQGQLIDRATVSENGSIGLSMVEAGYRLGLQGMNHDISGKLMALQSYGQLDEGFYEQLKAYDIYQVKEIFNIEHWYTYCEDSNIANHSLLNWIATVHQRVGDVLEDMFARHADTFSRICYTGGVAQNIIWNTRLKEKYPNLFIPPHCGDEGLSLGCLEHLRRKHELKPFDLSEFPFIQSDQGYAPPSAETIKEMASLLAQGKTVAWYYGQGEIGPRALGHRSILMNPLVPDAKKIVNEIKQREGFRPFGASVLKEHKHKYFDQSYDDPYMLYTAVVKDKSLESITHIDGTARVQTVYTGEFRTLLEEFYKLTGCAVLLNTSLNINKEPIAGHRYQAIELYDTGAVDALAIGNLLLKD